MDNEDHQSYFQFLKFVQARETRYSEILFENWGNNSIMPFLAVVEGKRIEQKQSRGLKLRISPKD